MVAPRRPRARKPRKVTPRLIHTMVRRLVRQFDHKQIILFGSQARGTAGPDSDLGRLSVRPCLKVRSFMLAPDPGVIEAVSKWVEKAKGDLWIASLALKHAGAGRPQDGVCFHAPQRVEKYLKALLAWHSIDSPKTHNLKTLLALLPNRVHPELAVAEQERLTEFATVSRCPGDYEPITLTEARRAVTLARRVRRQARRWLPKQALQARRWIFSITP